MKRVYSKFPNLLYRSSQDDKQLAEILAEEEVEYMVIKEKPIKIEKKLGGIAQTSII